MEPQKKPTIISPNGENRLNSRRQFLRYAGAGAAAMTLLAVGCKDDNVHDTLPGETGGGSTAGTVKLGKGDVGILNYAYALEQLEAAFYTQVIQTQFSGITQAEISLLTDIRDHEIAHREFFKKALGTAAIAGLEVNFSSIDFSSRQSVLATAKAFEDLGVQAYNGAGKFITTPDYLVLAGKIVSVEARHAAYVRDLIMNGDFSGSDVVDANGLDKATIPSMVLPVAQTFVKTKIDGSELP
ncbi:MAG: ferritin-like domain-containing protein [Mucilaginibacter polytrichastri]|nr:ferritin-like domain-containing protein [Mucilaginibacter polytrichastri]